MISLIQRSALFSPANGASISIVEKNGIMAVGKEKKT